MIAGQTAAGAGVQVGSVVGVEVGTVVGVEVGTGLLAGARARGYYRY